TALCPGGTTGMTTKGFDDEVDYGRNQVRVARAEPLAKDIAGLGLGDHLDDIAKATEALARGLGRTGGDGEGKAHTPGSRRIVQAVRQCAASFNFVYEGTSRLLDEVSDAHERATLEAIVGSLDGMLARAPASATASAVVTPGPGAAGEGGPKTG